MVLRCSVLWLAALLGSCAVVLAQGPFRPDLISRPRPRPRPGIPPLFFPQPSLNSDCTLRGTSTRGTCKPIYDCLPVLQNYREILPTFCYLRGRVLNVCCPGASPVTDVSPPLVSFSCGTTSQNPITFLVQQNFIASTLAKSDLRSSVAEVLRREPGINLPSLSAPSRLARSASSVGSLRPGSSLAPSFLDLVSSPFSREKVGEFKRLRPDLLEEIAVVNGINAFRNSWPWMALLGQRTGSSTTWFCDGVLINEKWVLTASHCAIRVLPNVVRLGEHNLATTSESTHEDVGVSDVIFHPDYTYPQGYQDLALIELDRRVSIRNAVRPVCLPWGREPLPSVRSLVTLTGWGETSFRGTRSDILQEASLYLLEKSKCVSSYSGLSDYAEKYPKGITSDLLCIGDLDGQGQDACQGDSGGPVVYRNGNKYVLAGIVSRGFGCGNPDFPGLYASVHHAPDLAWIKRVAF